MHHNIIANQEVTLLNGSVFCVEVLGKGCSGRFCYGGHKGVHSERVLIIFACSCCLVLADSRVLINWRPGRHCRDLFLHKTDQGLHPIASYGRM